MNVSPTTSHDMGTGRDTVVTHTRALLYDPVVMRFTTLVPLAEKYYPTSPYAYCQNDPMGYIDLDGEKIEMATNSSVRFKEDYRIAYNYLKENQASFVLDKLEEIQHTYYIKEYSGDSYFDHKTNTIYWNPRKAIMTNTCYTLTAAEILSHEADHAVEYDTDPEGALKRAQTPDEDYVTKEEKRVIEGSEQQVALKLKRVQEFGKTRTNHFGNGFEVDSPIKEEVDGAVVVYNPNEPKSE